MGAGLTLEELRERVEREAEPRLRQRRRLIELGELAQQTRQRHLALFPETETSPRVAALYLVHLFRSLPQRERAMFYRAVYPFFIASQGQEDLEQLILKARANRFYLSFEAFQFLAYFGEALLPARDGEVPGYWNHAVIRSITQSSLRLMSAHYLLSPASFALRLQRLANEAGDAFTMKLVRDARGSTEYLYEHTPAVLAALVRLFPKDVAEFSLWENALFTGRFLSRLYPDIQVSFSALPRKVDSGEVVTSPQARLVFPKALRWRSIGALGWSLVRFVRNRSRRGEGVLESEGVMVGGDASALFARMLPLWRRHRERLFAAFWTRAEHRVFFDLPPEYGVDEAQRRTTSVFETIEEQAHVRVLQGVKNLRKELIGTALQVSVGVMRHLSFASLDHLIASGHAFLREFDPDDTFHGHSHRVGVILVRLTSLYPDLIQPSPRKVYALGLLHDLGKLLIPPEVLTKPGRLDEIEWMFIRMHPVVGALLFAPCFEGAGHVTCVQAAFTNLLHHENWSGGGYPYGLVVQERPRLPLEGDLAAETSSTRFLVRLLRIADSLDAMFSKAFQPRYGERAYHVTVPKGADEEKLVEYVVNDLRARSGKWYDPVLIERLGPREIHELVAAYARLDSTGGLLDPHGLADVPGGHALVRFLRELDVFGVA